MGGIETLHGSNDAANAAKGLGQRLRLALFAVAAAMTTACAGLGNDRVPDGPAQAQQLVLVTTADWDANQGRMQRFERAGGQWHAVGDAAAVTIGRAGSAWGLGLHAPQSDGPSKREGDGRAPAGMFRIGTAFGYAEDVATALPYAAMSASDYCIDVSQSPLYNRIVDADRVGAEAVAGSTEPMRLDLHHDGDRRYREGFVIGHNPQAQPGAGSCIFAHLWRAQGEATAGCTAMEPSDMQRLLAWLQPGAAPLFVLLPRQDYARLRTAWALPALEPAP